MTKKKNSASTRVRMSTDPSLKKHKSPLQKKRVLQVARKRTSEPKILRRLKRFLIQRNQKVKIHKRRSGGIRTVSNTNTLRLSASRASNRKRNCPAESPPVLTDQASIDNERKFKCPAESPPVLPIQASNDGERKFKCPAESPPDLPIQRPAPYMRGDKKILRESNAVCPATFIPSTSHSADVRAGFDRNLEPDKIVKMAEFQGKVYFIMKWKGSQIMDLVPTKIANERCPQVVIEFYEKHLTNVHNRAMDSYE